MFDILQKKVRYFGKSWTLDRLEILLSIVNFEYIPDRVSLSFTQSISGEYQMVPYILNWKCWESHHYNTDQYKPLHIYERCLRTKSQIKLDILHLKPFSFFRCIFTRVKFPFSTHLTHSELVLYHLHTSVHSEQRSFSIVVSFDLIFELWNTR